MTNITKYCLLLPFIFFFLQSCGNKSLSSVKSRTYELRVIPTRSSAKLKFNELAKHTIPQGLSMPAWKGCEDMDMRGIFSKCTLGKINQHINSHLQIPAEAMEKVIEGDATVTFLVDNKGKVMDATVTKDPGGGIASEAARLVASFPEWDSALINGEESIPTEISMDIRFDIVLR